MPDEPNSFTEDVLDGRALVSVDLKNDGNLAMIVVNQRQPAKVFQITQKEKKNWIGLRLQGTCSNRDAFGAKIFVTSGGKKQQRWYYPSNGYSSQTESQLLIGLGKNTDVEEVTVRWPLGHEEKFSALAINKYHKLTEGETCVK